MPKLSHKQHRENGTHNWYESDNKGLEKKTLI
jgi:hypothetical protein